MSCNAKRLAMASMLAGLFLTVGAGSASALSTRYFSELLTSDQAFALPSDTRVTLDTSTDHSLLQIVLDGTYEAGLGLGDGYLSGTGDSVVYVHRFTPTATVDSIQNVWLAVGVLDDQFLDRAETAEIRLDGSSWKSGQATINLFSGDVTAYFSDNDGELTVAVVSRTGDFDVTSSLFGVEYSIDSAVSARGDIVGVPEPGAAILFCAGLLLVGGGIRRGRFEVAVG